MNCLLSCMLWLPVGFFLGYTVCHLISTFKPETSYLLSHISADVTALHVKVDKVVTAVEKKV